MNLWTGISPSQGLYLHTTTQHRETRTISMSRAGYEPTIPVFERSKTVLALRPRGHWDRHLRNVRVCVCVYVYEGVIKSFRTGHLEREQQMVQLSATRWSCIATLWVSLESFATITLCVASQRVFIVVVVYYRLSPETFGYTVRVYVCVCVCVPFEYTFPLLLH
jgi:hypothetical protein